MNNKVFISYSSVDSHLANEVLKVVEESGFQCFLDQKDIKWGDDVMESVTDSLSKCFSVIVIVSPGSLKSQWVSFEIGHASALGKSILPFLTHPSLEVPSFVRKFHYKTRISEIKEYFYSQSALLNRPLNVDVIETEIVQNDHVQNDNQPSNEGNTTYLKELFMMWVIAGEIESCELAAFKSLLVHDRDANPLDTMTAWVEDSKIKAANAVGLPASQFEFLDLNLTVNLELLSIEDSFQRLWKAAVERQKPSNMAKVRVALIEFVGEERQQELIGFWNRLIC